MPAIATNLLAENEGDQQVYCGLDCMITLEVHEALTKVLTERGSNQDPIIYSFERALQAPALDMMLRGWKIDEYERKKGQNELRLILEKLDRVLQRLAYAVWDKPLNPNSPKQLIEFFYGAMGLPEQWISTKGVRRISTNREAMEKLEVYFHAMPIIATILDMKEIGKQLSVLETEITYEGRFNTSYNIGGTQTGRWSSSEASDGTGSNTQNIDPTLRKMFVADPGYKLFGIDLEQTEAWDVGWLQGTILGDWSYLDACQSGDLHVRTSKLIWRDLPWTGDPKKDRAIADQNFYRNFSHRDMSKRGGHLTNYHGTPWTAARSLKVPLQLMVNFRKSYLEAYPAFTKWWAWVARQLQTTRYLETPYGRGRHFFGRPNDDSTLRKAIAFVPQAATADRLNLGLWRVWKHMGGTVQLLGQVHDAIYGQYLETEDEQTLLPAIMEHLKVPLHHGTRTMTVKSEAKVGWNWGNFSAKNPDGLKKFALYQRDNRKRHTGETKLW